MDPAGQASSSVSATTALVVFPRIAVRGLHGKCHPRHAAERSISKRRPDVGWGSTLLLRAPGWLPRRDSALRARRGAIGSSGSRGPWALAGSAVRSARLARGLRSLSGTKAPRRRTVQADGWFGEGIRLSWGEPVRTTPGGERYPRGSTANHTAGGSSHQNDAERALQKRTQPVRTGLESKNSSSRQCPWAVGTSAADIPCAHVARISTIKPWLPHAQPGNAAQSGQRAARCGPSTRCRSSSLRECSASARRSSRRAPFTRATCIES